jgi:ubiquinone/menaquinone biosynthesis C-methylase UbiE
MEQTTPQDPFALPASDRQRVNEQSEREYFDQHLGGENYAKFIEAYAYSKVVLRAKLIAPFLPVSAKLLDLGCGTGHLTRTLARTHDCVGLDLSTSQVAEARRQGSVNGRARYVVGSAYDLPFEPGCFGAVVCSGSLHHLLDLEGVLGQIERVLAEGGRLIAIEPSSRRSRLINGLASGMSRIFPAKADPLAGLESPHTPTEHPISAEQLISAMKRRGFRILSYSSHRFVDNFSLFRQPGFWRFLSLSVIDPVLGSLPYFRRLGGTFIVVGEKVPVSQT